MKAATRERIKKAESDWLLAVSLTRRRKVPVNDHACFHFQQAAEKYMKARLEEATTHIPKTHQVDDLIRLALPLEPLWAALVPAAARISDYGVCVRYPGNEATAQEMKTAHQDAKTIRESARQALGL
ncbi:MAG: HEPN domain-containing protein [Prosthecobacter sp.]|uniref:HEPN domain-containing protein n=1 Tax=Prosthecobacter sp. TaxID=1965333 RepID=UPI003BB1A71C